MKQQLMVTCVATLACVISVQIPAQAPTEPHLDQVFANLHSSDPNIRAGANSRIIEVMQTDMPRIEQYSNLLCASLADPDAYIRQQASGILSVIAELYPEHHGVLLTCADALVAAGADHAPRVRLNALSVLATSTIGPFPQARGVFLIALNDPVVNYNGFGALGLLKLASAGDRSGVIAVGSALDAATDNEKKIAILRAVEHSGIRDQSLFQAVIARLYDGEPDVQMAAVQAVAVTASDKSSAVATLQKVAATSSISSSVRQAAQLRAEQIAAK